MLAFFQDRGHECVETQRFQILAMTGVSIFAVFLANPEWNEIWTDSGSLYFSESVPEFMLGCLRNIYIATNSNRLGVDVGIIHTECSKIII